MGEKKEIESAYVSWIPTVSGRLSFRIIGDSHFGFFSEKKRPKFFNREIGGKRYIFVKQSRYLGDSIIITKRGWWELYLFAEADIHIAEGTSVDSTENNNIFLRKGSIKGFVACIWRECDRELKDLRDDFSSILKKGEKKELNHEDENFIKLKKDLSVNIIKEIRKNDEKIFHCNVEIFRNGLVLLRGIEIGEKIDWRKEGVNNFYNQLYFFIRDISHKHRHHEENEDTILTCYIFDSKDKWRLKLLNSLYFSIISNSRHNKPKYSSRADGILAYVETLKNILDVDTGHMDISIRNSLRSMHERRTARISENISRAGQVVAWLSLFYAFYYGSLGIFYDKEHGERLSKIRNMITYIYDNSIYLNTDVFLFSVIFPIMLALSIYYKDHIFNIKIFLAIKRALLHNIWVQILGSVVGFLLFFIGIYFLYLF